MAGGLQRISLVLHSEPITVGDQVVQPVARLAGWWQAWGANGGGALVRLTPDRVAIQKDGQQRTISLADPTWHSLRSMALVAVTVTLVCFFVMLLTAALTRRR